MDMVNKFWLIDDLLPSRWNLEGKWNHPEASIYSFIHFCPPTTDRRSNVFPCDLHWFLNTCALLWILNTCKAIIHRSCCSLFSSTGICITIFISTTSVSPAGLISFGFEFCSHLVLLQLHLTDQPEKDRCKLPVHVKIRTSSEFESAVPLQ